jgi:hypothetical protein
MTSPSFKSNSISAAASYANKARAYFARFSSFFAVGGAAARDAAAEGADPIVIVARTDARATHGLEEAISRAKLFRENGADWRFVEARPLIASDRL